MKQIILQSLTLTNFKGERNRTTVFNSTTTTIRGANGTGKSRHFDAFTWLLFGKDSDDRKDYEIRTLVAGQPLHKVECSVEGTLLVNGTPLTLKRSLMENWVKPRGQQEEVYKGDITECWWNNAPVKVSEYDRRVAEILPPQLFKMLTNPTFFCTMKWAAQREVLFSLAGAIDDATIAAAVPNYQALMDIIGTMGVKDFLAERTATKKRLKKDLDGIAPRIDQVYKMMPAVEDYTQLEAAISKIDKQVAQIDDDIASITAASDNYAAILRDMQDDINTLRRDSQEIVFAAEEKRRTAIHEATQRRQEEERAIRDAQQTIERATREKTRHQQQLARDEAALTALKEQQEGYRKEWYEENGKVYDGDTLCPYCHQELPQEQQDVAQQVFREKQHATLAAIHRKGEETGRQIGDREKKNEALRATIANDDDTLADAQQALLKHQQTLATLPLPPANTVDPHTLPAWVEKQQEIEQKTAALRDKEQQTMPTTWAQTAQRKALLDQRTDLAARLATRATTDKHREEIQRLEEEGRQLAQQIADIERDEYTLQEFTRRKTEECERRVNTLFHTVQFRLFDYTLDGNPIETCVAQINGVPYPAANTAAQINAGVDIINTLCRHHGIQAPIFIDNREAINDLLPTASQVINLVVSTDQQLVIE